MFLATFVRVCYNKYGDKMRVIKRIILAIFASIIFLAIITYGYIIVINNSIADKIEKSLIDHKLPENTELVDSISVAGKLTGNGNGMQYMGVILVKSGLNGQKLQEYYSNNFNFIEVKEQKT